MTPPARSIYLFGIYLVAAGGFIVGAPGTFLALLRLPPTTDPWLRVLGVPIMSIGLLHVACGRAEQTGFFRASIWARVFVLVTLSALVALRLAPVIVLLFGLVDAAGAAWTRLALARSETVGRV